MLNVFSCKNAEKTSAPIEEVLLLKSIKMPIVGGAGKGGMRILLNIQKEGSIILDSIVYNKKSSKINEVRKEGGSIWIESYFHNEKEMVRGKGLVEYKAEGKSCQLYYSVNGESKNILVPALELKQDDTLWK